MHGPATMPACWSNCARRLLSCQLRLPPPTLDDLLSLKRRRGDAARIQAIDSPTSLDGHRANSCEGVNHQPDQRAIARSRSPTGVVMSIASSIALDSSAVSTGVFPFRMECREPRTELVGLKGMIWPTTSQSKRTRSAARCCFTERAESRPCDCST